ncbi:MAG: hypothetical protein ABIJ47_02060 [Candidatus Bathyarchaeota archaeon]
MDSHSTTFYPNDYNITQGVYVSGATPDDVMGIDNDYFIVDATGYTTSTAVYYPSIYNLLGGTTLFSGSISDVSSDNGVYMSFKSYLSDNPNIEDYVDNDTSDVDSTADKGFSSNFTDQQVGPDASYDELREQYFGGLVEDYVDLDTSDVDSSSDVGNLVDFSNMKSLSLGYSTLSEAVSPVKNVSSAESWSGTGANSHSFQYNLQSGAGNNRLVVVGVTWEDAEASASASVTFDGVPMINVASVTIGSGYSAYAGMWYMNESLLPSTTGNKWVSVSVSQAITREIYVTVAEYTGVAQEAPDDYATHANTASGNTAVTLTVADSGSIVVAVGVQGGTNSWANTNNLDNIQDALLTSFGGALGNHENAASGDITVGWNSLDTREGMVGAVWSAFTNYQLDQEIQWTNPVNYLQGAELVVMTGAHTGNEDLTVQYWSIGSSQWVTLGNLTANSWNNYTIGSYLTGLDFTIRFKGTIETGDVVQDTWQIDAAFIRLLGSGSREDYVDNDASDMDSSPDKGTHSSFASQQAGPDAVYDTLTESGKINTTLIDAESFESTWPPTGWSATGNWNREANEAYQGTYSADFDGSSSGNLVTPSFDCSGASSIYVSFWFRDDDLDDDDFLLQYWDGGQWDTIQDMNGYSEDTWHHWEQNVTDSQYFINGFQVRFVGNTVFWGETIYVDVVTIKKEVKSCELDLEVQWTNVDHLLPYEELCIYAGTTGAEDLKVEVWNTTTSSWETLLSDLTANSWNNVSISGWLTGNNFTIRYIGGTETGDSTQDQWQIDVALIKVWANETAQYTLDFEYQWTGADFWEQNEELCIYGGTMGAEDILVDVWYGDAWNNVLSDLSPGWNNVSITSYLDSSSLTIRLRGGSEASDAIRDAWLIDASLIHVWGPEYTAEVELLGTSNLYEWSQVEWTTDSAWTNESVRVELQLYDYNSSSYPTAGDGYTSYTVETADLDETKNQVITSSPENFRNATGWWKMKFTGKMYTQFDLNLDYLALNTTYYSEYTAETEFIFTDITDNQSPYLNFTVVTHNSVDGATVTIQVWNYTSSSFPTSGQGYLSYVSTGFNNTSHLNVTLNPGTLLSGTYARIKVTSALATTLSYQQQTNFVRLLQDESQRLHDYALRITNTGADPYTVRLNHLGDADIGRLINCTIYLSSGGTQLQVLDGIVTVSQGGWVGLGGFSSLDILISASSITRDPKSMISAEVEALKTGTSTYTKLPIQLVIY